MGSGNRSRLRARDRRSVVAELARQVARGTYQADPAKIALAIVARLQRPARGLLPPAPGDGEP